MNYGLASVFTRDWSIGPKGESLERRRMTVVIHTMYTFCYRNFEVYRWTTLKPCCIHLDGSLRHDDEHIIIEFISDVNVLCHKIFEVRSRTSAKVLNASYHTASSL